MSKKVTPDKPLHELIEITDQMVEDLNYELSRKARSPKTARTRQQQHSFWSSINIYLKELKQHRQS